MALLEEQFTEKLQAGASPITYEGNEGKEQQIAQALWDKLPPQVRMQFGNFSQFFSSGAWKKVLAALQQQMQGGQEEIQETETETIGRAPQEGLGALMPVILLLMVVTLLTASMTGTSSPLILVVFIIS